MIRLRHRGSGDRRRGDISTLVRTRPAGLSAPPPIPVNGYIRRIMSPASVADYEAISDSTWQVGTTGTISGVANSNWNVLYCYFTVANQRTQAVDRIMNPIRWTCAAPASDGGTYDWWGPTPNTSQFLAMGVYSHSFDWAPFGFAAAISDKLLPASSHAVFPSDFAQISGYTLPMPGGCRRRGTSVVEWVEPVFQALAPTTFINATNESTGAIVSVHAIRHRINGTAVGDLIINPLLHGTSADMRVDALPDDTYSIDIWYRVRSLTALNFPPVPGKSCVYIPTSRISNGSTRQYKAGVDNYCPTLWISNVDFAPAFNRLLQTYSVTISGHVGWTLKDGTDGPHKMITADGWTATIGSGFVAWQKTLNNGYVNQIILRFDREVAHVELYPGPLASTAAVVCYRAASGSDYRTSTVSADIGTITHADSGPFDQAGTTTFNLVQWTLESASPAEKQQIPEGISGGPLPVHIDIPTTITLTRVSQ